MAEKVIKFTKLSSNIHFDKKNVTEKIIVLIKFNHYF